MRVPTTEGPSVAAAPLQAPMQRSSATPGLLQSTQNTQLEQAGGELTKIGLEMQDRRDTDVVLRNETRLRDEFSTWEAEAKQLRGEQAYGVAGKVRQWWTDTTAKVTQGLENPAQRQSLERIAVRMASQSIGTFEMFEAEQRRVSVAEAAQASVNSLINRAAANVTDPVLLEATGAEIRTRLGAIAKANGWAPEVEQARLASTLTSFHKQVIQGLAQDNPAQAASYFEAKKGEIEGSQHAEIGAFAQRATANRMGDQAADAAWQSLGPKSDRDPVTLDTLEANIRNALKGNDEAVRAGIAAVRERALAFKDARRERDDQLEASVNKAILDGAGARQIRSMPAFLQLAPESARKIMDYVENRALRGEQVAAARESRAAAAESREQSRLTREGMGAYLAYSNPETLVRMSESQVLNLLPDLGNELTKQLMEKRRELAKPEKLAEARMDEDDFKRVALEMGLDPYGVMAQHASTRKAKLGELRFRVEQLIDMTQRRNGKTLSRPEKLELVRQEMAKTVIVENSGGLMSWLTFASDRRPVITVMPDQIYDVSIPKQDRQQLADAMRRKFAATGAKQYEPTEENLRRFYLLSKSESAAYILPFKK